MNINSNNSLDSVTGKSTRSKSPVTPEPKTTGSVSAESTAKTGVDQVVLSQEAKKLSTLENKIKSISDADLEKVSAIKRAIAEGRFEINPERIAENMLKQDELLG
jgi:negative regulator of flagellin synthesis FlgM